MKHASEWVTADRLLPTAELEAAWDSIVVSDAYKERLLNQALLSLRLRATLSFDVTALHGLILLFGAPGTGKTTLARGLAQQLCPLVGGSARLIEINPHGLMSGEHGASQNNVFQLLCEEIPGRAEDGKPTVVVLDEVESMAVARGAASLEANPADVHRATDAVLMALDTNARKHPHLLFVSTSNFTEALDEAFCSRADAAIEVPLPGAVGALAILQRTLNDFGAAYPTLGALAKNPRLRMAARELANLDGRRIRKVVTEALAAQRRTVVDIDSLKIEELVAAARRINDAAAKEATREAA
jgi:SpoVK/Ycf46/Vps4 family AAA+-type ATPase